ncbi:hypothetical protein [Bradyrhizobium sp. CCGUVB23]|uniref:hypothetical protein n=1 Tax=Bradyrhizobium sp. CCGUVB23 TaxID=2949630 RepID=UPI0020B39840|nr:hypothetical protein [Bradyrhizobium sp. CCGUVB23]MCP3460024.1 hypothetical protein [Bradyrhizobium sp. CCGUVB23]
MDGRNRGRAEMASHRQIEANRSNATRSTGPKTLSGKARSSRNTVRHGLARSRSQSDDAEIARLSRAISSGLQQQGVSDKVMDVARCKLQLLRIRAIRQRILAALLQGSVQADGTDLRGLERYERVALARQKRTLRSLTTPGADAGSKLASFRNFYGQ